MNNTTPYTRTHTHTHTHTRTHPHTYLGIQEHVSTDHIWIAVEGQCKHAFEEITAYAMQCGNSSMFGRILGEGSKGLTGESKKPPPTPPHVSLPSRFVPHRLPVSSQPSSRPTRVEALYIQSSSISRAENLRI